MTKSQTQKLHQQSTGLHDKAQLILNNDEVHSFDFVIMALVKVCRHSSEQAEQCALIAHYNNSCVVYTGKLSVVESMFEELFASGLDVELRETSAAAV